MTLRDYFAAHALPSAIAFHASHAIETNSLLPCDQCAGLAYAIAESMLKRREK